MWGGGCGCGQVGVVVGRWVWGRGCGWVGRCGCVEVDVGVSMENPTPQHKFTYLEPDCGSSFGHYTHQSTERLQNCTH